jgi:type I restriction enzyme S subunit
MSSLIVQLSEVCDVKDGTHYTPPNTGGPFPFITVKDMTDDGLSFSNCSWISELEFAKAKHAKACPETGSVLFSKDGTVGKVHVVGQTRPFAALSSIAILRPNITRVDSRYLGYALQCPEILRDAENRKTGSALQRIILEDLKDVSIPLPSLSRQREIVLHLDIANKLLRMRRYALQMCDELLPATFLETFEPPGNNWPTVTIEELAERKPNAIRTGPFGSQLLHSEFTDQGIAVLGIDNAVNNRFEWGERRYITAEKYEQLKRYTVFPGDVIITIMGTCGRCAVVPQGIALAINTKHLCCITLDQNQALPDFVHAAFLYHTRIRRQLGAAEKGAIMDGLNMTIIRELSLPLPPLSLQRQFAHFVRRHERLRADHLEALRQADHLFQALLHHAFSLNELRAAAALPADGLRIAPG